MSDRSRGTVAQMSECDRCEKTIRKGYALDSVVHQYESWVCDDCLKDTDVMVDP